MKERLDVLLVNRGYFDSREKAKRAIMAGLVFVEGRLSDKAGTAYDSECEITVKGDTCPYVSRGGLKLARAIEAFKIDLKGDICADIGASTGGFTDCMLQNGAEKVYSIDVGYGQLDYKLRTDERVVNIEKCNVRYLDRALIKEPVDFVSIDVSFISLKLIFPVAADIMAEDGRCVCLIKPQFEAGRDQVGKHGIVKDPAVHREVIEKTVGYAASNGLYSAGLSYSPIKGAKGNIEYLLYLCKDDNLRYNIDDIFIEYIVENSHGELK